MSKGTVASAPSSWKPLRSLIEPLSARGFWSGRQPTYAKIFACSSPIGGSATVAVDVVRDRTACEKSFRPHRRPHSQAAIVLVPLWADDRPPFAHRVPQGPSNHLLASIARFCKHRLLTYYAEHAKRGPTSTGHGDRGARARRAAAPARVDVWALIRDLVSAGTTVLLTTQYLDEAATSYVAPIAPGDRRPEAQEAEQTAQPAAGCPSGGGRCSRSCMTCAVRSAICVMKVPKRSQAWRQAAHQRGDRQERRARDEGPASKPASLTKQKVARRGDPTSVEVRRSVGAVNRAHARIEALAALAVRNRGLAGQPPWTST